MGVGFQLYIQTPESPVKCQGNRTVAHRERGVPPGPLQGRVGNLKSGSGLRVATEHLTGAGSAQANSRGQLGPPVTPQSA